MQYQHNEALSWLHTGSTDTTVMKMAAVQGSAAPGTALKRSLSVQRNNAESVTVDGLIVDPMCLLTQPATQGPECPFSLEDTLVLQQMRRCV